MTLGVAELVAALVAPASAPLLAVGGAFVDRTPAWLKDLAIDWFGTADKIALFVGMAAVVAVLAATAGVLARERPALGSGMVVALGGVAAVAALTRPSPDALAPLPSVAGVVAGLLALRWLLARLPATDVGRAGADVRDASPSPSPSPSRSRSPSPDRRRFLLAAGAAGAVAVLSAAGARVVTATARGVAAAREALRLPAPARPADPLPPGVDVDVEGVEPFVTPNGDFYRIDTALRVPQVDAASWSLRVHGLVEEEVELDFEELLDADLVEAWVTLTCVSNEVGGDLAGNARWLGLPVREVLARARPLPGADMVLSTSVDGWTASTPLEVLTDDRDALLAVGMNGEPLPVEHGYPVRMVVPGLYGFVSATKWVVDLEVTRFADATAYWTDRGWAERAPVKTMSRIEAPRPFARLGAGPVAVGGTAWAQTRGISAVQVRVDDGEWQDATLAAGAGPDTWRQWSWTWDATPGSHTLWVRAVDGEGQVQTPERAEPVPDGASGWHSRVVTVE
ncbi:molybdopterin-dependent oxidoreductase [Thalassiella azotivora]